MTLTLDETLWTEEVNGSRDLMLPTSSFFSPRSQTHSTQSSNCDKIGLAVVGTTSQGQRGESRTVLPIPAAPSSRDTAATLDFKGRLYTVNQICKMR